MGLEKKLADERGDVLAPNYPRGRPDHTAPFNQKQYERIGHVNQ